MFVCLFFLAKAITYDIHFCEGQGFTHELTVPINTIRAPRQGCLRFNYKFGRSRTKDTFCAINIYHRRMNENNNQIHYRHLTTLQDGYDQEWQTASLTFFEYDEKYQNRVSFRQCVVATLLLLTWSQKQSACQKGFLLFMKLNIYMYMIYIAPGNGIS